MFELIFGNCILQDAEHLGCDPDLRWGKPLIGLARWLMSCRSGVVEDIGWERAVLVSHSGSLTYSHPKVQFPLPQ